MMKRNLLLADVILFFAGCSSTPPAAQSGPAPIDDPSGARRVAPSDPLSFRMSATDLVPEGKCRIMAQGYNDQDCAGIETIAPLDVNIVYRPSFQYLVVCIMASNQGGVIAGVDVYDAHEGHHVAVLLKKDGQMPAATCKGIWDATKGELGLG